MKSTQYSEKVLDHFRNPRNVGTLQGEDVSVGRVGNPVCGDLMEIYIKVKEDRIEDIKLKTFGCGSAIATASMITEMAKGKTLDEAMKITRNDVAGELEGLPPIKMHCSNLAADALQDAIKKYREKQHHQPESGVKAPGIVKEIGKYRDYLGKGILEKLDNPSVLAGKRVLVIDRGYQSAELAKKILTATSRVIFITPGKEMSLDSALTKELKNAGVKILYESEILEVGGFKEIEKVLIHDLNEDEQYELFVDIIINLPPT
jgi:FeS cluster assembly scaffold protein NifU